MIKHFRYLIDQDYNTIIQPIFLKEQLTQDNHNNLLKAEQIAQEEIGGVLIQRYDLTEEFSPTVIWEFGATYTPADRIYFDYTPFSASMTYSLGSCVTTTCSYGCSYDYHNCHGSYSNWQHYNYDNFNNCYHNTNAYIQTGTTSLAATTSFPTSNWTELGQRFYDLYYVTYPAPLFNYQILYTKGQQVFYKGQIWTAVITDLPDSQSYAAQFIDINNVPTGIFPDDTVRNANYTVWLPSGVYNTTPLTGQTFSYTQSGTSSIFCGTYSIIDTLPTNTKFWTFGDNRSQMIVLHYMQIVLYYLHKTIAPQNIPELRIKAYNDALKYLYDLAYGKKSSVVLTDQPKEGLIYYTGNVRKSSFY